MCWDSDRLEMTALISLGWSHTLADAGRLRLSAGLCCQTVQTSYDDDKQRVQDRYVLVCNVPL